MLFSEMFKIMVKKVTFEDFRGGRSPQSPPPGSAPGHKLTTFGGLNLEKSGSSIR